jgi:hypothetical protein
MHVSCMYDFEISNLKFQIQIFDELVSKYNQLNFKFLVYYFSSIYYICVCIYENSSNI